MKKKVVLAFSGGLDTSYCVKYLGDDKGVRNSHDHGKLPAGFDDSGDKGD